MLFVYEGEPPPEVNVSSLVASGSQMQGGPIVTFDQKAPPEPVHATESQKVADVRMIDFSHVSYSEASRVGTTNDGGADHIVITSAGGAPASGEWSGLHDLPGHCHDKGYALGLANIIACIERVLREGR